MLTTAAVLLVCSQSTKGGWFGPSLGSVPRVTLFGQALSGPVPNVVLGPAAGTSLDAKASYCGARVTLPWCKVGVKSPFLIADVRPGPHRGAYAAIARRLLGYALAAQVCT